MPPRRSDARSPSAGSYRVAEGTQVHHDGRVYAAGEVLEAPPPVAAEWLLLGLVFESKGSAKK